MICLESKDKRSLLLWFKQNRALHPWRVLWSETKDPYVVWVSEIMLQQTRIEAVTPKYEAFLEKFPRLSDLARAKESDLREAVAGLGYYRRFAWMKEAATALTAAAGKLPATYDELLEVKGIGPYTAAAIASICFTEQRAVCDGNIERLYCRIHNTQLPSNDPRVKQRASAWAEEQIPSKDPGAWNEALMELGQKVCTPTSPKCDKCPFHNVCHSHKLGTTHLAPAKKTRPEWKRICLEAKIPTLIKGDQISIGLIKRGVKHRFLRDMAGFDFSVSETIPQPIDFNHTITNHKIAGRIKIRRLKTKTDAYDWVDFDAIEKTLHSSLDKKIWNAAQKYF